MDTQSNIVFDWTKAKYSPLIDLNKFITENYDWLIDWFSNIRFVKYDPSRLQTFINTRRFYTSAGKLKIKSELFREHIYDLLSHMIFGVEYTDKSAYQPVYSMSGFIQQMERLPVKSDRIRIQASMMFKFTEDKYDNVLEYKSICKLICLN